jgi:hypothetical protein
MRVTFHRLADHEWAHVLIERDDGVLYRMHAGPVTAELPHDLVHYTVEDSLALADGIWGAIAALRRAGERWRALPVGGRLEREWPPYRRITAQPIRRTRGRAAVRRHR